MKIQLFPLLFPLLLVSCSRTPETIRKLDSILDRPEIYEQAFRTRTDSLKKELSRAGSDSGQFQLASLLFEAYKIYNVDTCLIYATQMRDCARTAKDKLMARSALIFALVYLERFPQALELYGPPPADIPYGEDIQIYYESAHHLLLNLPSFQPHLRDSCRILRHLLRQELLQRDSTTYLACCYRAREQEYANEHIQARRTWEAILERQDLTPRQRAMAEYDLARSYQRDKNIDKAIEHLARSAAIDLQSATKGYNSLYVLARRLFERGDNERACRYIMRTMSDATIYNYPVYSRRSSEQARFIYRAFLRESVLRSRQQLALVIALIVLLVLSLLILAIRWVYSARERKAHEQIRLSNLQLKDGNNIRDHILSKYLEKTAGYIVKVDEMKSSMRRTYRKEGLDALLRILRSPAYAETEFKNYFVDFDNSVLDLFPRFIEEVNRLMPPEARLAVKEDGALGTHLRILALIRLGITDSRQIANALNTSIRTIYCYRHRMRRDALCPGEEFENKVREIGLYD